MDKECEFQVLNIVACVATDCMALILSCTEFSKSLDDPRVLARQCHAKKDKYAFDALCNAKKYKTYSVEKKLEAAEYVAKLFTKDSTKSDALMWAAKHGHLEVATALVSYGANVHHCLQSVLTIACSNGHTRIVELLLNNGADIHAHYDEPLFYSVWDDTNLKVVELLLNRGADVHACQDRAFRIASACGTLRVIELLLDFGANIHAKNDEALCNAIMMNENTDVAELLLRRGAHIHWNNLPYLVSKGKLDFIRLLLDHGVDIHDQNDLALREACSFDNVHVVKLLLERGADIHVENDAPLKQAAQQGHTHIVHVLLNNGAATGINDAICRAARFGQFDIVEMLVERGGVTDLRAIKKAIQFATEQRNYKIASYLESKCCTIE